MVLKRARDYLTTYGLLAILAVLILGWTILALLLLSPLPRRWRRAGVRHSMMSGFRFFCGCLTLSGAYELDLSAIDALRGGPPLILAPNHPTSMDAILFLTRHPNLACILKPALLNNFFLGVGARLAGFIRSDPPLRMIKDAVAELERGALVLLFPEGTRTTRHPVNALTGSVAVIARRARAPIQVAFIETDSPYLGKGWPFFKAPRLPIHFRVRLGSRLQAPADTAACLEALAAEYALELADAPQRAWIAAAAPRPALSER
jgi:1-acyl-sn-glycerol-3-phosphate acyltransferase